MCNLEIVNFVKNNEDWEELLKKDPYNLKIKRKNNLILFQYSHIDSNFSYKLVREARGIILEENTWRIVRFAFEKFFNYGEKNQHNINFTTAKALEKIDGSLVSLYFYDNEWKLASNGMIDAKDAIIENYENGLPVKMSFFDLFLDIYKHNDCKIDLDKLNKNYTYTFELVHPFNKIVVNYPSMNLYLIHIRDNINLQEIDIFSYDSIIFKNFLKPEILDISFCKNIEDLNKYIKNLKDNREGIVLLDNDFNRVKIKTETYVLLHYLLNNKNISYKSIMKMILIGEIEEFVSCFPDYKDLYIKLDNKLKDFYNEIIEKFNNNYTIIRKDFALKVKLFDYCGVLFKLYDYYIKDNNINLENIVKNIVKDMDIDKIFKLDFFKDFNC